MALSLSSPVGLVAGNGSFPREFVQNAKARGLDVVVVAHHGETDPQIASEALHVTWIRVAQLGKIISTFTRFGVKNAAFVGGIRRMNLFRDLRPDWVALKIAARVGGISDDKILRGAAEELERNGITIFAPNELLANSRLPVGTLTRRPLTKTELVDALAGWIAAKGIGLLDIGQTVVVKQGVIAAAEAAEGTDETIRRGGAVAGKGAVVVKVPKPQQDLRLDLPAIGRHTISMMAEGGLRAIVLEAGKSLLLEPQEVVAMADRAGITIVAYLDRSELEAELARFK